MGADDGPNTQRSSVLLFFTLLFVICLSSDYTSRGINPSPSKITAGFEGGEKEKLEGTEGQRYQVWFQDLGLNPQSERSRASFCRSLFGSSIPNQLGED